MQTNALKNRLALFLKYLGVSQAKFAENTGLSKGFANNVGDSIRVEKLKMITNVYPDLNVNWLKTGEGDMLKSGKQNEVISPKKPKENNYKMVPVYNFDAVGGMDSWNEVIDSPTYIEKYIPFAGAGSDDICVHVTGNSMMPVYSAGSLLLVRKIDGWRDYFGYGHCYVLLLKDGRRILKEIQESEIDVTKNVLCVSFNPKHPKEELPRSFIVDVYKVIMTLTNEGF